MRRNGFTASRHRRRIKPCPAQISVYVDHVDEHHARASAAGAEIRSTPEDMPYGDRRHDGYDAEGHLWSFAQHMRDVPPEEWGATPAG